MTALMGYRYPGNIRELKSILQSAVNLARGGAIRAEHLPVDIGRKPVSRPFPTGSPEDFVPLAEMEKAHILKMYDHTGRNKSQSARLLGVSLNTLRRKLAAYGVK